MIAALVLMVMPIVYLLGLASIMLALQLTPWRDSGVVMFALAMVWGLIVMAGVLLVARRMNRDPAGV
jgi:hypothetical protein